MVCGSVPPARRKGLIYVAGHSLYARIPSWLSDETAVLGSVFAVPRMPWMYPVL